LHPHLHPRVIFRIGVYCLCGNHADFAGRTIQFEINSPRSQTTTRLQFPVVVSKCQSGSVMTSRLFTSNLTVTASAFIGSNLPTRRHYVRFSRDRTTIADWTVPNWQRMGESNDSWFIWRNDSRVRRQRRRRLSEIRPFRSGGSWTTRVSRMTAGQVCFFSHTIWTLG